ncbi:MAG: acetyl-CoA hydrolase/transferase family protein [Thermoanaerobacteraceae bacterium]|nr:acetyl-CoA hydrolase/transferase family protein [Thermoanaerobacteraceae bacterium]
MNKWLEQYHSKLTSAGEAVKTIESGDRVVLGLACGLPRALTRALADRAHKLKDVEVVHLVSIEEGCYCLPEMAGHIRHNSLFVGPATRCAVNEGRADYTPCLFSEVPRLFKEGYLPVDVAMIQVSPPDDFGYCSLGISVDCTRAAAECARKVIAQVNRNMPRTMGDSFMHVSQFHYIVEFDEPLIELPRPHITEVEEQIGRYVAELVEDRATLQLGIGAIPDAIIRFLKDKRDLGIHTEMFSDGVVELYEEGIVTCEAKSLHRGKMVATFLMGTKKLYDFVNDNPVVEMYPVDYVNDPFIISQNSRMVSINSALQIDLLGQVCAEMLGGRQYSGVGGQLDYVRGASRAKGGKAVIAMPSTAQKGQYSRIVVALEPGTAVTTTRNDVHYVVTEYGIANLRGKTVKQRARELISIAHPRFRDRLTYDAQKAGLL